MQIEIREIVREETRALALRLAERIMQQMEPITLGELFRTSPEGADAAGRAAGDAAAEVVTAAVRAPATPPVDKPAASKGKPQATAAGKVPALSAMAERVLDYLGKSPDAQAGAIQKAAKASKAQLRAAMVQLRAASKVTSTGNKRATRYRLA